MNIYKTELFPYIAGDSLVGKEVTVTIRRVKVENVKGHGGEDEKKVLVYFQQSNKGLILNKTNAKVIARAYGAETDDWGGKEVVLYSEKVKAFGETHNAARVKLPKDVHDKMVMSEPRAIYDDSGEFSHYERPATDPGPDQDGADYTDQKAFANPDYAAKSAQADVDAANTDLFGG